MNFKLNALVAAALLAAAGSANAAIDPGLNGNGEIWFAVYDTVAQKSFSFDTGVYMNDFVGTGVWTLEQDGAFVDATYDWRVRAEKPLLQTLAPIMRPLLEANHKWAMNQGEESLRLELLRRRAATPDARRSVPPPPGPVTYAAVGLLGGAALIGGGIGYLILRQRRRAKQRRDC